MHRVPNFVRSRAGRIGVAAAVVAVAVLSTAAPAYAHHSVLSGTTECSDGQHIVTWTIEGVSGVNLPMTIASASATNNGTTYAVTGYTNPVPDNGSTTATTVLPTGSTGTVRLDVHSTWSDGVSVDNSTTVELQHNCNTTTTAAPTTTTSTTMAPTTTAAATTTTTTTIGIQGTTTVPPFTVPPTSTTVPPNTTPISGQGGPTTTTAPAAISGRLPFTGGGGGFPLLFGLCLLGGGALLVVRKRRSWSRS